MARVTVTERLDVCDLCGDSKSYLKKCIACGSDYCLMCQHTIQGCVTMPDVCRLCAQRDDVVAVALKHATRLSAIEDERDAEIKALPRGKRQSGERFYDTG